MKFAFTADLHYGNLTGKDDILSFIENMNGQSVDYIVIAGDLATRGATHNEFPELIELFRNFEGGVLFTAGNHDIWTKTESSFNLLTEKIPELTKETNCHFLDGNPVVIGKTAFVGSIGWYDYSFRFVPENLSRMFQEYYFRFSSEPQSFRWNEITPEHYEGKQCRISPDGEKWRLSTWQDRNFVKWDFTDYSFLDYCHDRLKKDIESVLPGSERIIAVMHHLPFASFVPDIPDPMWGFHRAYLGSEKTGEFLFSFPQITDIFFGHSHRNTSKEINGKSAHNLFFHNGQGYKIMQFS
ncbi:MAG: metallophosphoesterase [Firmicutes bacterium]|nr:metallophosphoesterase [Bacillota bacterium]